MTTCYLAPSTDTYYRMDSYTEY